MLGLRSGRLFGAVAAAVAGAIGIAAHLTHAGAAPEERTISFYHIHTEERLTVTYKRDGQYIPEALAQINHIMRDWRKNQEIAIDPVTIDIIWEMHEELGSKEPVHIICGYRSHETNEMLRRTVGGQASQSQHITGKAIDFTFPDIPLRQMRYAALVRERGGVGYYPSSGIPFIHVDSARVRHWPGIGRDELALLFPNGHSKHDTSLTAADAKRARERGGDAARQVALYFEMRDRPKMTTLVADASDVMTPPPPKPTPAVRPAPVAPDLRMGVGAPMPPPEEVQRTAAPALVTAPRVAERPRLEDAERRRLDALVRLASLDGPPQAALPVAPATMTAPAAEAPPPKPKFTMASFEPFAAPLAALRASASESKPEAPAAATDAVATPTVADQAIPRLPSLVAAEAAAKAGRSSGTEALGDDFDEEHPEELFYRAFSLAPLLTSSASADEPVLAALIHPDAEHAFDTLEDDGLVEHVTLRQGTDVAGPTQIPAFQAVASAPADGLIRTSSSR